MKTIVSLCLLGILTVSAVFVHAADAPLQPVPEIPPVPKPVPQTQKITDPTLAFFVALSACRAGDYQEKNIMTKIVGPAMLKHAINGPDHNGDCEALLQTPDNRILECLFTNSELQKVADQHFMTGVLNATIDDPDTESQKSDMIWTQMKTDSCQFLEE